MSKLTAWFRDYTMVMTGAGIGAGLMYMFDPDQGNRRQALLRDRIYGLFNDLDDFMDKATRDLNNRTTGLMAETMAMFGNQPVPDRVLAERVRANLGHRVSHPRALEVTARDGTIILSGPILSAEVEPLITRVSMIRGVKGVENHLEVHDQPGNIPALQGDTAAHQERIQRMVETWSPSQRLVIGAPGGILTLYGLLRGGPIGALTSLLGMGMVLRAATNKPLASLLGQSAAEHQHTVEIQKTININTPIDQVYNFWYSFENFPRFMAYVRQVQNLGNGKSHWVVSGPGGAPVEWDAIITEQVPNQMIAWKTLPGSLVDQVGRVQFQSNPDGSTRVDIQISYTPPAGVFGHTVATLLGRDPKQEMDEDLVRLKSLFEHGKTSTDTGQVTRQEVASSS